MNHLIANHGCWFCKENIVANIEISVVAKALSDWSVWGKIVPTDYHISGDRKLSCFRKKVIIGEIEMV